VIGFPFVTVRVGKTVGKLETVLVGVLEVAVGVGRSTVGGGFASGAAIVGEGFTPTSTVRIAGETWTELEIWKIEYPVMPTKITTQHNKKANPTQPINKIFWVSFNILFYLDNFQSF
jgi:hypothetical protein